MLFKFADGIKVTDAITPVSQILINYEYIMFRYMDFELLFENMLLKLILKPGSSKLYSSAANTNPYLLGWK